MRFSIGVVIALLIVSPAMSQTSDSAAARAKAALSLARIKHGTTACSECEKKAAAMLALAAKERDRSACLDDVAEAAAKAAAENKWLFVWVGMTCHDSPHVRAAFPGVVHCHADESSGDKTPRLLIGPLSDGTYRVFRKDAVEKKDAPAAIRKDVDSHEAKLSISLSPASATSVNC